MHAELLFLEDIINLDLYPKLRQLRIHQTGTLEQLMPPLQLQLPVLLNRNQLHHLRQRILHVQWKLPALQLHVLELRRGQQHHQVLSLLRSNLSRHHHSLLQELPHRSLSLFQLDRGVAVPDGVLPDPKLDVLPELSGQLQQLPLLQHPLLGLRHRLLPQRLPLLPLLPPQLHLLLLLHQTGLPRLLHRLLPLIRHLQGLPQQLQQVLLRHHMHHLRAELLPQRRNMHLLRPLNR